ncbi:probable uridine nucleosidase 1 isoform X1 [Cottoperca gobio]|uniref:Probable uridine nucleosidase 1 isoform X1 n=2 Tax=Cottoperca gobio TaxID=56716 RepID=A0A6J2RZ13_COTGO|nr:probable uridine nucleosidase 1 isoform X1 [Cottoperca gobio]
MLSEESALRLAAVFGAQKSRQSESSRHLLGPPAVCMAVIIRNVALTSHVFSCSVRRLFAADRRCFQSVRGSVAAGKHYSSSVSHSETGSTMSKKLLFDADCGVDDAQAIMLALAAPNVELLGITCVHGNTTVENVCKNTLRVLQACNKLQIPVFKGAAKPILGNSISVGDFHGEDGLGDAPDPNAPGLDLLQKEGAVSAIIRIVNENPGEVSLVATAPLTNLALAVRMDPSLPSKLRGLYIMGGNTECQ